MENEIISALIGASTAIVTLVSGNYFTKRQRKREDLFPRKVTAYTQYAVLLAEIRLDYEALSALETGSDIIPYKNPRSPLQIDIHFRKGIVKDYLFFSNATKKRTDRITELIRNSSQLIFNKSLGSYDITSEQLRICYEEMIKECDNEIERIYKEIGINNI